MLPCDYFIKICKNTTVRLYLIVDGKKFRISLYTPQLLSKVIDTLKDSGYVCAITNKGLCAWQEIAD